MSHTTLIAARELATQLANPDWCIFDVRHQLADSSDGERAYAAGHLPRAQFLHCDRDLSGDKTGSNGRHPLPLAPVLAEKLANSGVSSASQVVVYDDSHGMIASRLWWMLRWLGHRKVAVLDGGLDAWHAIGGDLTTAIDKPHRGDFRASIGPAAVPTSFIVDNLQTAELCLVDARSPDRYHGENETLDPVAGHIPGAKNRFFRHNLEPNGGFKSPSALRGEWLDVLADASPTKVVHQCGSGISACHNLLSMEYAGLTGSRLYAGSWSEWCADPRRPVV